MHYSKRGCAENIKERSDNMLALFQRAEHEGISEKKREILEQRAARQLEFVEAYIKTLKELIGQDYE